MLNCLDNLGFLFYAITIQSFLFQYTYLLLLLNFSHPSFPCVNINISFLLILLQGLGDFRVIELLLMCVGHHQYEVTL